MKALLLLSVLISLSSPALARIGETREQCDARYGKPVKAGDANEVKYQKAGLNVICNFIDGKCSAIYFSKEQKDPKSRAASISDEDGKILMEANSGGAPWVKTGEMVDVGYEGWKCGELEARFLKHDPSSLRITTPLYRKQEEEEMAAKGKGKLKDF